MTMLRVNLDQFKDLVTSLRDSCQSLDEFVKYANKANEAFISGNEGSWEEDEGSRFILLQNAFLALSDGLGDCSKDCEKASDDLSGEVRGKRDAVLAAVGAQACNPNDIVCDDSATVVAACDHSLSDLDALNRNIRTAKDRAMGLAGGSEQDTILDELTGLSGNVRTQRSKVEEGRRAWKAYTACVEDFRGTYVGRFSRSLVTGDMLEKARVNVNQVIADKVKMNWGPTGTAKTNAKAAGTIFSAVGMFLFSNGYEYEDWKKLLLASAQDGATKQYWKRFLNKLNLKEDIKSKFSWYHTDLSTGKEDGWCKVMGERGRHSRGYLANEYVPYGRHASLDPPASAETGAVLGRAGSGVLKSVGIAGDVMAIWGTYKEVTNAYSHTRGSSAEKFAAGATEAVEGGIEFAGGKAVGAAIGAGFGGPVGALVGFTVGTAVDILWSHIKESSGYLNMKHSVNRGIYNVAKQFG